MRSVTVGDLLRSIRKDRGLSSQVVADRAGIARKTLTRWERGEFLPRLPELELALRALQATDQDRNTLLRLLDAPRAYKAVRIQSQARGEDLPHLGELIRGMRLRAGLTLEQLAREIGVSHTTISRWERGEALPCREHIIAACHSLGARDPERAVLISGVSKGTISLGSLVRRQTGPQAIDQIEAKWNTTHASYTTPDGYALHNIRCLALTEEAMALFREQPQVERTIVQILRSHARHLSLSDAWAASIRVTDRLLTITEGKPEYYDSWLWAQVSRARALASNSDCLLNSSNTTPAMAKRGIAILSRLRTMSGAPIIEAWRDMVLAKLYAKTGDGQAAIDLATNSCRIIGRADNLNELAVRRTDLAGIYLYLNQPQDALKHLAYNSQILIENRLHGMLVHANALADAGVNDTMSM